ncbi:MAG: hypothetical protein MZV70_46650 [Desulfobacterales bacterium]|nr:hypothetical protein [Desulfobacterales bacterium]
MRKRRPKASSPRPRRRLRHFPSSAALATLLDIADYALHRRVLTPRLDPGSVLAHLYRPFPISGIPTCRIRRLVSPGAPSALAAGKRQGMRRAFDWGGGAGGGCCCWRPASARSGPRMRGPSSRWARLRSRPATPRPRAMRPSPRPAAGGRPRRHGGAFARGLRREFPQAERGRCWTARTHSCRTSGSCPKPLPASSTGCWCRPPCRCKPIQELATRAGGRRVGAAPAAARWRSTVEGTGNLANSVKFRKALSSHPGRGGDPGEGNEAQRDHALG